MCHERSCKEQLGYGLKSTVYCLRLCMHQKVCYLLMQISDVLIALAYIYQALEKNIVIEFVLKFLGFFSSGFWFHWLASYFNKYSPYVVRISSLFCFILKVEPIIKNPEGFRQLSYCYIKTTISLSIWVLSLWNRTEMLATPWILWREPPQILK